MTVVPLLSPVTAKDSLGTKLTSFKKSHLKWLQEQRLRDKKGQPSRKCLHYLFMVCIWGHTCRSTHGEVRESLWKSILSFYHVESRAVRLGSTEEEPFPAQFPTWIPWVSIDSSNGISSPATEGLKKKWAPAKHSPWVLKSQGSSHRKGHWSKFLKDCCLETPTCIHTVCVCVY